MKNFAIMFIMAIVACTMMFSNINRASAQHRGDEVARASALDAMDAAMSAHEAVRNDRTELEAKIGKAQRLAEAAAARGDKATEARISSKMDEYKAELAEADGRLAKIEAELTKRGCGVYTDSKAQAKCFDTLKAITADGEKEALTTFARVVRPPLMRKVEKTAGGEVLEETYFAEKDGKLVSPSGDIPFARMVRSTGGDTPVYTEIQIGERSPLVLPQLRGERIDGVHPAVKWVIPAVAGGLAGAGIAGMVDPDGPNGGNFSYGAAGKGAMVGVASGLVVSLLWEILD